MTVNSYFNLYSATNEQDLVENMVIESIQARGFDVQYIPRDSVNPDYLTGDSPGEIFEAAFPIEMYLESVDSFGGDTMMMSKFGLHIEDTATLVVSKKRFKEETATNADISYPRQNDLLYLPFSKSIVEIESAPTEEPFYQLGKNYVYKLRVRAFNYNHQDFSTGITDVDTFTLGLDLDGDDLLAGDTFGDNIDIDTEAEDAVTGLLDLSKDNPFVR